MLSVEKSASGGENNVGPVAPQAPAAEPNSSELSQPQTHSSPPPVEPKKKMPFLKLLIIGIVLIIIIGAIGSGTYFLGKNSSSKQAYQTPTVTKTPSPSPTIDSTANWKSYTNTKYGISFSYPKEAVITEKDESNSGDARKYLITVSLKDMNGKSIGNYYVQILNSTFSNTKTFIDSWFGGIEAGPSNISQTTINNQSAYKLFMAKAATSPAGSASIVFQKNTTVISISNETKDGVTESIMNDPILNKISSTFRFTDSTSSTDTSTWKTYTNDKFGITFKYPGDWSILRQNPKDIYNSILKRNINYDFTEIGTSNDLSLNVELTENPAASSISIDKSKKIILPDGTEASFYTSFNEGPTPKRGYWTTLWFARGGNEYSIYLISSEKLGSQEQTMKNILSTIKFTN